VAPVMGVLGVRWLRLGLLVGLLMLGLVQAASADTGDVKIKPEKPLPTAHFVLNKNGTVTATVIGGWSWPTHGSNCNENRAGAGVAVDWFDPTDPGNELGASVTIEGKSVPIAVGGTGNELNPADNVVHPTENDGEFGTAAVVNIVKPSEYKTWRGGCGVYTVDRYFKNSEAAQKGELTEGLVAHGNFGNGAPGEVDLEGNPFVNPTPPGSSAQRGALLSHTYKSAKDVTRICAVMYDVHGKEASQNNGVGIANGEKDVTAGGNSHNNDNGVQGNSGTPTGNSCAAIRIPQPKIPTKATNATLNPSTKSATVEDAAKLESGTANAKGTLTFKLYSDAKCEKEVSATTVEVNKGANGAEYPSGPVQVTANGTYFWVVDYSGDGENPPASSECKAEHESSSVREPGILVEKTPASQAVMPGGKATFTITVKNTGEVDLEHVVVKDLPTPACDREIENSKKEKGVLTVGESVSYECESSALEGPLTNIAEACGVHEGVEVCGEGEAHVKIEQFSVKKEQRLKGELTYTKSPISTTQVPATVEYLITVKDTGETAITPEALKDSKCENPTGPSKSPIAPGESATYTCEHTIAGAPSTWTNVATVKGNGFEEKSNEVEAKAEEERKFSVIKEQRFKGQVSYTKSPISTKQIPATVEYLITVKNEGNASLALEGLKDAKCENPKGPSKSPIAPGESATYTCEYTIAEAPATWANVATVKGNGSEEHSNEVEAEVEEERKFSVTKEQRFKGEPEYTIKPLKTKMVPATVEYLITVHNEGNAKLTLEALKDPKCENAQGPSKNPLAPGESATYTCEHTIAEAPSTWANVATVKGNGSEEHSNEVEAEVEEERKFSVTKEQRFKGEAGYTKAPLSTKKAPVTIEYLITVHNEGNAKLTLEALKDADCENAQGPSKNPLAPGDSAAYTCEHTITEAPAIWTNVATVKGNGAEEHSNEVEAEIEEERKFSVTKEQRFKGEANYTTEPLKTKTVPVTVEYLVTVHNEGNAKLSLESLTDSKCENVKGPSKSPIAPGESATYTCDHTITEAPSTWTNVATVKANGSEQPSNKVEAQAEEERKFSARKEQRFKGEPSYTKSPIATTQVPVTVEYLITVHNEGNAKLSLEALKDSKCDNVKGPSKSPIAPGESATYTCEHTIKEAPSTWTNVATVKGNGSEEESNEVEAKVEEERVFSVKKEQRFKGQLSYTRQPISTQQVPATVEYLITVKNEGNAGLALEGLKDAKCDNAQGPSKSPIAPGESATYTCEHTMIEAPSTWTNVATVKANGSEENSNEVEAEVAEERKFSVKKEQRFKGEPEYTTALLKTKTVPVTAEYLITVTNEGNAKLTLEELKDPNCVNPSGPSKSPIAHGESATYACEHMITEAPSTWTNVATVKANGSEEASNEVEAKVEEERKFSVTKEQRFKGETLYTKNSLSTTQLPATVEYLITVHNEGNAQLTPEALKDSKCENAKGPSKNPLAPGESATYTCEHTITEAPSTWTNAAIVTGNGSEEESNEVEAKVEEERKFSVKKEQRFKGQVGYTANPIITKTVPATVEYLITVKNEGNVKLALEGLKDSKCENIKGPSKSPIGSGESATYTCEHTIIETASTWANVATVKGSGLEEKSNEVEAKAEEEHKFSVTKEQRFNGETFYSKNPISTTKVPATVEYLITVHNEGNAKLALEALKDAKCENMKGPSKSSIASGESATYTCEHTITEAPSTWTNVATVKGNSFEKPSNEVETKVEEERKFAVTKEQRLKGETAYTKNPLSTATVPATIEYLITVQNEGNAKLALEGLNDPRCENAKGPSKTPIGPGESATYTCEHTITTAAATWTNVATVKGNGSEKTSNEVEGKTAVQKVEAGCTVSESEILLHNAAGSKRKPFTVHISALGIKEITFYLDGRKIVGLTASQAKHGEFSVKIDPRKLRYGVHTVSAKTAMTEGVCRPIARSTRFVRPKPAVVKPKFTG
jgi:uncharacterized repeat protein (TIGR01451 family)